MMFFFGVVIRHQYPPFLVSILVSDRNSKTETALLRIFHLESNLLMTVSSILWIVFTIAVAWKTRLLLLSLSKVANETILVDLLS